MRGFVKDLFNEKGGKQSLTSLVNDQIDIKM